MQLHLYLIKIRARILILRTKALNSILMKVLKNLTKIKLSSHFALIGILSVLMLFMGSTLSAQGNLPKTQSLSTLKVEELSDEQIAQFKVKYLSDGYSLADLDKELTKRDLPSTEIEKLKLRLQKLESKGVDETKENEENDFESKTKLGPKTEIKATDVFSLLKPKIFGNELFNNPKLSFEPNLKMAAPLNYQVGPEDELIIDIFGYSEQSYKLKISSEGNVRIPNLGPVFVAGLTLEQAQQKISAKLISLYPNIGTGKTSVAISLGSIRSIKVIILGEVNAPGTYTLPSVSTVFNALYASGGPNSNGSFRKIKLIRGNKVIANIDIYDFLMNGSSKGNLPLKDMDVIKVDAYEARVELKGFVKRDGFYEVLAKDNLASLLNYCGGFAPKAYTERVKLIRNTGFQQRVAEVEKKQFPTFTLNNGDVIFVDTILSRYENRVEIEGAVFRPGFFSIDDNATLSQLIKSAGGVREEAFLSRATILRRRADNSQEVSAIDVAKVLEGTIDMTLKREDKITIASNFEMKEPQTITISGDVKYPGTYPYAHNMRVEDVIILAGGLLESATTENIQIAQRVEDANRADKDAILSNVIKISIEKNLKEKSGENYFLKPYDAITIFPKPGYLAQKQVQIRGEVMFPGSYAILRSDDRVSDLIQRAGGITALGYAGGAILIRKRSNNYQDIIVKENKLLALKRLTKDTVKAAKLIAEEMEKTTDVVGINLSKIMKKPGSKEDVVLSANDILEIPSVNQTVFITGEVLYPVRISFAPNKGFSSYVSNAGGFSSKALKRRAYIVYPNGTAKDTKSFFGIKIYPKVLPGSELVIPPKEDKKSLSPLEIVTITTSLTSMLVLISTIIR